MEIGKIELMDDATAKLQSVNVWQSRIRKSTQDNRKSENGFKLFHSHRS